MSRVPPDAGDLDATTDFNLDDDDSARRLARDVALATELLSCGALSERQVGETLADWSLYGSVSLRQHLQNTGLMSPEQLADLDQRVEKTLAETPLEKAPGESGASSVSSTIMQFDTTGRVAKLLGVASVAGGLTATENCAGVTRYRLIRPLGQGGLGKVWLARDLALQRMVALKEIAAGRDNAATIQRFRNEAEITGRLEHPGIVPVYQLAENVENGKVYYTMRFLGKGTLQDSIAEYHERCADGDDDPMLLQHLLVSFVSVCHAIGHAHSRKVIHRDLKPENVVIDSFGQVIVIDWGLAKLIDEAELEHVGDPSQTARGDSSRTGDGQVLGTPLFMAPEQALGRLDEVDERTDIYGLGAMLFAICTGRAPHEAARSRSSSSVSGRRHAGRALFTEIATGPTPQAIEANPSIDPALSAICAKAMARKRYARYRNAADLAEDVQRWMAGQPVTAYAETTGQQVRRWIRTHDRLAQLLAGLFAVLLAALATLMMSAKHSRDAAHEKLYQEAIGDVREIELQLRDVADDIGKDARFMSTLPPIQGIIRARAGDEGESEEVWLTRLETIYLGLLRANPNYLAVTFVAAGATPELQAPPAAEPDGEAPVASQVGVPSADIIRVERNANDRSYVRLVPRSRLAATDDDELLAEVIRQELGDVRFSLEPRRQQGAYAEKTRRMIAGVPVFDEVTGEPFGMVMIEIDLNEELIAILDSLGEVTEETFIGQADGEAWISMKPGEPPRLEPPGTKLLALCPESAELFVDQALPCEATDGRTYYGMRFRQDANSKGVAVLVRVAAGE
ncbi:MAG: serine/threonine protein kinase [Planctomycetales bacterium]|nr:serine/threonine protein kinase [Planctomycetales bacterium]